MAKVIVTRQGVQAFLECFLRNLPHLRRAFLVVPHCARDEYARLCAFAVIGFRAWITKLPPHWLFVARPLYVTDQRFVTDDAHSVLLALKGLKV